MATEPIVDALGGAGDRPTLVVHHGSTDEPALSPRSRAILDIVAQALPRAVQSWDRLALILLEVDHPDLLAGAARPSAALGVAVELIDSLETAVRAEDVVLRCGDFCAALLVDVEDGVTAPQLVERLRGTAEQAVCDAAEAPLSISAGGVVRRGAEAGHAASLLVEAEAALQRARAGGGGRTEVVGVPARERAATLGLVVARGGADPCPPRDAEDTVHLFTESSAIRDRLRIDAERIRVRLRCEDGAFVLDRIGAQLLLDHVHHWWAPEEQSQLLAASAPPLAGVPWTTIPALDLRRRLATPWLPRLLEQGGIRSVLQPIVHLATGQVYGYEALMRGSVDGLNLSPLQIIEAARAHDMLGAMDRVARTTAIAQGFPRLGRQQHLFVNFLPSAIHDPAVALETTWAMARQIGADPGRITFEVVESEQYPNSRLLSAILESYRSEGARVALDDLGAGSANLSHLTELRPDVVKLDISLIKGLSPSDPRQHLVRAVIDYAHALGILVVAEGIETAAECVLVRHLGADLGQGFYLGRPAAPDAWIND